MDCGLGGLCVVQTNRTDWDVLFTIRFRTAVESTRIGIEVIPRTRGLSGRPDDKTTDALLVPKF